MKKKLTAKLPTIVKRLNESQTLDTPLDYLSYSAMVKFSTNPTMFKIRYINKDFIETGNNASSVLGKATHMALQVYYDNIDTDKDEVKEGLQAGMEYLEEYNDNYIVFNSKYDNKQKIMEKFAFAYNSYITEKKDEAVEVISTEEDFLQNINVEWRGERLELPISLKGYTDKIIRDKKGRLVVIDYKTTSKFSDPEKIDGAKILQAVQYYFLILAQYGEAPYAMRYEEIKTSKNNDGSSQLREYEIVYADNDLFFDFYFRFYYDIVKALSGEMVYVPNINDFYDNEIAIISYIHRLDEEAEKAKQLKKFQVENITELLKKKIQNASNMRKLMKAAEKKFVSAKNLNYSKMKTEEKIAAKLMEYGMLIKFDSVINGLTFDLYQFTPSIGLKMSKLKSYVADIEQVIGVSGIRILAPIPNTTFVGFEIPKTERKFIENKPENKGFDIAMGIDIRGNEYRFDIRKAPHMLVAGATGSGKSVFLNSIIEQLSDNQEVELYLFDPKIVELAKYQNIAKVYLTEDENIYNSIEALVAEMNTRYKILAKAGARNIQEYSGNMKYKVVVIDEFGDLTIGNKIVTKKIDTGEVYQRGANKGEPKYEIESTNISKAISENILKLAQKARACGIHIIIATQRPSVDIITGSIKANFPTKVAFRTAKAIDSQVLLDEAGAERLLGKGDMIFASDEGQVRLQGYNA